MDIGRKINEIERRLAAMERASRLTHASLEDTALQVYDGSGSLRAIVGVQSDGTTAANIVNGPPPPQPSAPIVASVLGGVTVSWDGQFTDGSTVPLDWSRVEVHASTASSYTPVPATLQGTIETAQGATVVVSCETPVYVQLVARNTSGAASTPSAVVGPYGPTPVVADDVLDGIVTTVKLADDAVTAAKVATGAIDSTALADAAVTAQKIGAAAVTTGKLAAGAVNLNALTAYLSDTTSQRYVDAMGDSSVWSVLTKATTATFDFLTGVTDAPTGKTVAQATGYTVARGLVQVPYDPDVLYRVSFRVRTTAASTSGTDTLYAGILGVAADGVTLVNRSGANSFSSQHYICASNASQPSSSGWVTYTGYIKGRAATGGTGAAAPTTDPRLPGVVHADARFISPILYLNFGSGSSGSNSGTGTMQVDAVTIEALKTGVVDSTNLIAGSVTTAALAADSVTATQIAANAVTASELAAGAVTTAKLAAGAVTANEIAANTITAGNLAANSVTAAAITAGSVQTAALAADAVAAGKIAADAITSREIAALTITAGDIASNAITVGKIQAGAVDATALAADAITGKTITGGTITGSTITGGVFQTAASGERVTINYGGLNSIVVHDSDSAIGELSARGVIVSGSSGAAVWVDPNATYPRIRFYNASAGNWATVQVVESVTGDANLETSSGAFTGSGYTDMNWHTFMGNDVYVAERIRRSVLTTVIGGRLYLDPGYASLGYRNTDNPTQDQTVLVVQGNLAYLNKGRLQVLPVPTSDSALYIQQDPAHTGPFIRGTRDSVDYFRVDKDGNTTVTGMLTAGNIATGTVSITPSAASVPTSASITFPTLKGTTFRGYATANSTVPGVRTPVGAQGVTGVSMSSVTASSALVWVNRENTTATSIFWMVIGS